MKHQAVDRDGVIHRAAIYDRSRGKDETIRCSCGRTFKDRYGDSDFDRHLQDVDASAAPKALAESRAALASARERHGETPKEGT